MPMKPTQLCNLTKSAGPLSKKAHRVFLVLLIGVLASAKAWDAQSLGRAACQRCKAREHSNAGSHVTPADWGILQTSLIRQRLEQKWSSVVVTALLSVVSRVASEPGSKLASTAAKHTAHLLLHCLAYCEVLKPAQSTSHLSDPSDVSIDHLQQAVSEHRSAVPARAHGL